MKSIRWHLAHNRHLDLGLQAHIMGILNVTPDSFSDGGRYGSIDDVLRQAERMVEEGASIVDIGGESTRPGASAVTAEEEQARVLPVIEAISRRMDVIISVDTYRSDTARRGLEAGAHIVNDIWGLQHDPAIANLAADTGAGLVVMHNSREREIRRAPILDQFDFLQKSLLIADEAGVSRDHIVLDPGFGFGKDAKENIEIMAHFEELGAFNLPFLVGTSRKRLLGSLIGREPQDRDIGTAATSVLLRMKGAAIFRVHNVAANRDALAVADAVLFTNKSDQ
ncbi:MULTISPECIES: dihydropteroate synthase [Mesorhizobium]|uniref:Dihydropteroate synthase n=1 Tax=Mesorhizobium denitrificans TaxID=2294114 RepID=A0A371XBP3_9HYPH|nr:MULTISPECIES: dihydropteroate synthase [Mesorhizobium]RFC66632.1 dihydropteroate synthase [Mesorhizobium denitrificans]